MKNRALIFILTAMMATFSGLAVAGAGPTAFLKAKDKKLQALLQNADKNEDKIVKIVGKMLDFETLCKDALGKHWDGRSKAERKAFSDTLRALIEKNLLKRLKNTKNRRISYESESVNGSEAKVVTKVAVDDDPRADPLVIEYKMRKKGAAWGVVDMITDSVSLVGNYRSQFNKIISKDGWGTLMKKMKDKLAEKS